MFQGVFIESNNPFIPVCQSRNLYCSCWDSVNWGKGFRTVNCDVSRKLCKSDVVQCAQDQVGPQPRQPTTMMCTRYTIRDTHLFGSSSRSLPAQFKFSLSARLVHSKRCNVCVLHYMVTFTFTSMFTFHLSPFHLFTFSPFHLSTFIPVSSLKQGGTGVVPPVATPFATPSQ